MDCIRGPWGCKESDMTERLLLSLSESPVLRLGSYSSCPCQPSEVKKNSCHPSGAPNCPPRTWVAGREITAEEATCVTGEGRHSQLSRELTMKQLSHVLSLTKCPAKHRLRAYIQEEEAWSQRLLHTFRWQSTRKTCVLRGNLCIIEYLG